MVTSASQRHPETSKLPHPRNGTTAEMNGIEVLLIDRFFHLCGVNFRVEQMFCLLHV